MRGFRIGDGIGGALGMETGTPWTTLLWGARRFLLGELWYTRMAAYMTEMTRMAVAISRSVFKTSLLGSSFFILPTKPRTTDAPVPAINSGKSNDFINSTDIQ